MNTPRALIVVAAAGAIALSACGNDSSSKADNAPTTTAAAAVANDPTTTAGATAADPAMTTVDANTASDDELVAALEANGVSNASRWADEIQEYRPYATDDPTLAKLRDELSKYNPGQQTLDAIIASLTV